jgi:hypothetical protein
MAIGARRVEFNTAIEDRSAFGLIDGLLASREQCLLPKRPDAGCMVADTAVAVACATRCRSLGINIRSRLLKQAQQLRSQPIAALSGNGVQC